MPGIYLLLLAIGVLALGITTVGAQDQPVGNSKNQPAAAQKQEGDLLRGIQLFEAFNRDIDHQSPELIFKLFQFYGSYQGVYLETYLDINRKTFTGVITPHSKQNKVWAKLTQKQVKNVKQKISDFVSKTQVENIEPQKGQRYSAFVFNDGQKARRYNFIGPLPKELQDVFELLNAEFIKTAQLQNARYLKWENRLKEKYGDWQNKEGLIRGNEIKSHPLKDKNAVLLYLQGIKLPIKDPKFVQIPVYSALIFYQKGKIVKNTSSGLSFDPISRTDLGWGTAAHAYKIENELKLVYDPISKSVRIKKSSFQLAKGNLFIIKLDKNRTPKITQLKIYLDSPATDQDILSIFRKELGDETLQFK